MLARSGEVMVEGVLEEPVTCVEDFERLMAKGLDRRHTGATKMNTDSSRCRAPSGTPTPF